MALGRTLGELTGQGRGKVLLFCWLGWVFDFFDLILFSFLMTAIAGDLGLSVSADVPWIVGWTLAATAVGGFVFGRLADRRGRRFAITLSILVYSGGAFATAFADGYWTLLMARVFTGLGVGGEWGVGHAIVAETYPSRLRGRAAGILQAGAPVAMGAAAAVACFVGPEIGWRACFMLAGLPALLAFAARWMIPGEDRAPGRDGGQLMDLFRGELLRPSASILLLLMLHMTAFWCTYAWLPKVLMQELEADVASVGWFFLGVNAVHVLADVLFGFLADRFGRKRVFTVFCLSFALGLALVSMGYEALRGDLMSFGVAIGLVGLGAGTWSCFGVLFAENYDERVRATAAAGFYNLSRGVQLFSQSMMVWLFAVTGTFAVALHVGAVASALSAAVIWWVPAAEAARRRR